jgi:hypothetical protein
MDCDLDNPISCWWTYRLLTVRFCFQALVCRFKTDCSYLGMSNFPDALHQPEN